jgi:hypothetical protein
MSAFHAARHSSPPAPVNFTQLGSRFSKTWLGFASSAVTAHTAIPAPGSQANRGAMPAHNQNRDAYKSAVQFERIVFRILDGITATHPSEADELAEYTNQMLRCLRRSNNWVGTKRGNHESIQAAVWMVEALIILKGLDNNRVERALVTAGIELLERTEDALRAEGSLPPARDSH